MARKELIVQLVKILVETDKGMSEFIEPLPGDVVKGVVLAIVSFGEEALPELHQALVDSWSSIDLVHLVDVLGTIGSASSVPYLIEFHSQYGSFMSGTASVQALKMIGVEDAYLYLGNLLTQYVAGKQVFNTGAEIPIACEALGEWNDARAVPFLEQAVTIHDPNRMPETAFRELVKYPTAHAFLRNLAQSDSSLRKMIEMAFQETKT